MATLSNWRSPSGEENALILRARYSEAFDALAEYDRIGHLLLHRAATAPGKGVQTVVGIALLRRAVTIFSSLRTLLENSQSDAALALGRAFFELSLNYRCLAYGLTRRISLETTTNEGDREERSRYFFVASERRGLVQRSLMLVPGARFKPHSEQMATALEQELASEVARLREHYRTEWTRFGDVVPDPLIISRAVPNDPSWYSAWSPDSGVSTLRHLADLYDDAWEYAYLYEVFSAFMHGRGVRLDVTIENDEVTVHHPRSDSWFQLVGFFCLSWHAGLLMTAAKWNAPIMISDLQTLHSRFRAAIDALCPTEVPRLLP